MYTYGAMWMNEEIRRQGGTISFRDYMELALYHPVSGYYSAEGTRYGRRGDYLTAPTASEWYALTLRRALASVSRSVGALDLVDLASGDGAFLDGILHGYEEIELPEIGRAISVERSAARRRQQAERFHGDRRIAVVPELGEVPAPRGPVVVHASELYDAFPVHRLVGRETGPMEMWVAVEGDALAWAERPARTELSAYLERHRVDLQPGQIAEVNLAAEPEHRELLRWAGDDALVLVLDYGYEAARLYDPRGRRGGSLACFSGHRLNRDPLLAPGDQDITAHVNWDDLRRPAMDLGWLEIGLWPLAELLVRAGLPALVDERGLGLATELDAEVYARRQELKRLLNPEGMGSDLRVLVQAKGIFLTTAADDHLFSTSIRSSVISR